MASTLIFVLTAVVLLVAAITDMQSRRIPNWLTVPAIIVVLLIHLIWPTTAAWFYLIGLLPAIAMIIGTLTKKQFGWGDIKLMAFLGLAIGGYAPIFAFGISLIFMTMYAVIQLFVRSGKQGLPMAPFILLAALVIFVIDLTSFQMIY